MHNATKGVYAILGVSKVFSKMEKLSDLFATYYKQHFKYTTPLIDLCVYMSFKSVNHINIIGDALHM